MSDSKDKVRRSILERRLYAVRLRFDLPPINRRQQHELVTHCVRTLGDEGITDVDLRTLHKLTSRGFFDATGE